MSKPKNPKPLNRRGRRGRASEGPNPIDQHVGKRLRELRSRLGYSQKQISEMAGVTFQQHQKYERGVNRISASRLYLFARALGVTTDYFFQDMPLEVSKFGAQHVQGTAPKNRPEAPQLSEDAKRETLELVRAYYDIQDRGIRKNLVGTMRALARTEPNSPIHDRPRRGRPPAMKGRGVNGKGSGAAQAAA